MARGCPDPFAEHVVHVDMDAFFVEVERLDDHRLRGRPVVVGGLGRRGVVASASYEARARGVHSAMPIGEARRRCPEAVYRPPSPARYRAVSRRILTLLEAFTPFVEAASIDEAFLDVEGLRRHFPDVRTVGEEIRRRVRDEIGLPCSVGIATNRVVAKLASGRAKPDGLLLVPVGTEEAFLAPLPVGALPGVGAATGALLEELGVTTVGGLREVPVPVLEKRLGRSLGRHLAALARGRDARAVTGSARTHSISVEETFATDLVGGDAIRRELLRLCDRLAGRLARAGRRGRTVTLKVRDAQYRTVTRSATLVDPIVATQELWSVARRLLDRARVGEGRIRLLGLGVAGLVGEDAPVQLALDDPDREALAAVAARIRARFGEEALRPARLAERPEAGERA